MDKDKQTIQLENASLDNAYLFLYLLTEGYSINEVAKHFKTDSNNCLVRRKPDEVQDSMIQRALLLRLIWIRYIQRCFRRLRLV